MVAAEQLALDLEQVLRVPQMGHQRLGDVALGLHGVRERLHPGLQDRVLGVPLVELDLAAVRVDGRLHRVADVVDLVLLGHHRAGVVGRRQRVGRGVTERRTGRVRVAVGGRVGVDDPLDLAVHDRRVGVAVDGQPGRDRLDALLGRAVVQDPRTLADRPGVQDLRLAERHRVGGAVHRVGEVDPAVALVAVGLLTGVVGVVDLLLGTADDRVLRGLLAVVDPLLVLAEVALGRQVGLGEDRAALGIGAGPLGGDRAVAVGVAEVVVDPVVLRDAVEVQLTQTDDGVLVLAVLAVPVDVQVGREPVVVPDLLELLEGRRDHVRVHDADARRAVDLVPQLGLVGRAALPRVLGDLGVVDAVRLTRRLEVLLDVGRFLGLLVRLDLELLDDRRVQTADEDRREHHQTEADDGQLPGAPPQGGEEQQGADDRDAEQDRLGRQIGVGVDVPEARPVVGGLEIAGLHGQAVPVEPVGDRLQRHKDPEQDRQVPGGGRGGARSGAGDAQPAVEVVGERGGDHGEDRGREAEAQQEAVPGQVEGVEGDVQVELGVLLVEGHAVDPHQPGPPLPRRGGTGDQPDQRGDREQQPLLVRRDAHAVAVEALLLHRHGAQRRPQPVRQPDVEADREGHQQAEDEEQADLRPQGRGEDGRVVHRAVPEPVRPEAREHGERHAEYGKDAQRHEQGPDTPGRAAHSDPWPRRASAAVRHLESQGVHLEVRCRSVRPWSFRALRRAS